MAQLSIYIDDKILRKVERAAKEDHKSISKWVSEKINSNLTFNKPYKGTLEADRIEIL